MPRAGAVAASIGLVLATPPLAFWLIGDQSTVDEREHPDHMVRLDLDAGTIRLAGIAALVVAVVCATTLWRAYRREPPARPARLVGALVLAGVGVAGILRVVTAGVIGANIGGGLAIVGGGPALVAVVGYGVWPYLRQRPVSRASERR